MKSNQDDSIPGGIIRAEVAPEKPTAKLQSDERKAFANYLPLNKFFDNRSEQTFAALGRVAVVPEKPQRWQLSPESRKNILELSNNDDSGQSLAPLDETEFSSTDLLALASQGSEQTSESLELANHLWWKSRENLPLWKKQRSSTKVSFLEGLQNKRSKKFTDKIISELGFGEEESRLLFQTESFSRRTVYTRDYAAIPERVRALFKMVPQLIFTPRNRRQLCEFISYTSKYNIKITPRGRGTWALGGALLTEGGVVLEMASFEKKITVDKEKQLITVSSSIDFQEAEEALNRHNFDSQSAPKQQVRHYRWVHFRR